MTCKQREESAAGKTDKLFQMLVKDQIRWGLEWSLDLGLHGLLALMKKPLEGMSDKSKEGTTLHFLIFYSEVSFINISIV